MFTGYISDCGRVHYIEKTHNTMRLHIDCAYTDLQQGESIAIDGVCLTVTHQSAKRFTCDLSPETVQCTRVADLSIGAFVNLERSLCLSERLNGHVVMAHVDQTCVVEAKHILPEYLHYRFSGVEARSQAFLVNKGSIAINGVSLTLNKVEDDAFEVMLIPETLSKTNLGELLVGDRVNVEYDYFAKLVAKQMSLV